MAIQVSQNKSEGGAILLAALLGVFGICGVGQMYVGRIGRGLMVLFVGWLLFGLWYFLFLMCFVEGGAWVVLTIVEGFGDLAFWVWQIFDARAVCRQHNTELARASALYWYPPGPQH